MNEKTSRIVALVMCFILSLAILTGCSQKAEDNTVLIYTSINTERLAELQELLKEKFPNYQIVVEYQSTSKQTAQLLAEGTNSTVDITHDLAYSNIAKLSENGLLADLSNIVEFDKMVDYLVPSSKDYYVECLTGGAFIINKKVLEEKGLPVPATYEDLLDPCYKGLISMPDPKSSGTGYMFVKSLSNAWKDDDKVMAYFKELSNNILSFTSSGNGPLNSVMMEETAIGLGMTTNAIKAYNDGSIDLAVVFPTEGSPYTAYGQGIIKGKENKKAVVEVFKYLTTEHLGITLEKYAPEKALKDQASNLANFPTDVVYADMSNDTAAEKDRLLALWDEKVVK